MKKKDIFVKEKLKRDEVVKFDLFFKKERFDDSKERNYDYEYEIMIIFEEEYIEVVFIVESFERLFLSVEL